MPISESKLVHSDVWVGSILAFGFFSLIHDQRLSIIGQITCNEMQSRRATIKDT
jgi:hypothetical protein